MTQQFALVDPRLGTLELTCDNGYVIEQYDLGYRTPRVVAENRTFDDGQLDTTFYSGARTVNMTVGLKGSVAACSVLRDRLSAFTSQRRRPTLLIEEHNDPRLRQMTLRGHQHGIPISNPAYNRMTVSWSCPDGLITSREPRTVTLRPGVLDVDGRVYDLVHDRVYPFAFPSGSQSVVNEGYEDAHWVARLYGAMTSPRLICTGVGVVDLGGGGGLSLISQQMVELRSQGQSVTFDGNPLTSAAQYVDLAQTTSNWWRIPPGTSAVRLEADTFATDALAVLEWSDTW
ncbi:hypothetical protein [Desertimonas flava]|uniref:hypothetical protein n=1 Tax=Desertimonas flava TaxID=2064846 RepID=UPI000E34C650|nr:hypothetical protein [Desertimonas flava]